MIDFSCIANYKLTNITMTYHIMVWVIIALMTDKAYRVISPKLEDHWQSTVLVLSFLVILAIMLALNLI